MPAKVLSPGDQEIIDGKTDKFLATLLADQQIAGGDVRISNRLESELKQSFLSKPSS